MDDYFKLITASRFPRLTISMADALLETTNGGVLKTGWEIETNLSVKNGDCKRNSEMCPCVHVGNEDMDCWKKCALEKACTATSKRFDNCINKTKDCDKDTCPDCTNFNKLCDKTNTYACSQFIPACLFCEEYERNCTDCKYRFIPELNPLQARYALKQISRPSRSNESVGYIHSITGDGSLKGHSAHPEFEKKGLEVIGVGRKFKYELFYGLIKRIVEKAVKHGAWVDERCSIHTHLLTATNQKTGGVELPFEIPNIVVVNYFQLVRMMQNSIIWMFSALNKMDRLTRWERYRVSILETDPLLFKDMNLLIEENRARGHSNKYSFLNLLNMSMDATGTSKFHVELRSSDGMLSPSAITAYIGLPEAIFFKSVELSQYGVIQPFDDYLHKERDVRSRLMNNNPPDWSENRYSDTSSLTKADMDYLRNIATFWIDFLKGFITSDIMYHVLKRLAQTPPALRLVEGHSWERIEDDLTKDLLDNPDVCINEERDSELLSELMRFITMDTIRATSSEQWIGLATDRLYDSFGDRYKDMVSFRQDVERLIEAKMDRGQIKWLKIAQTMARTR